MDIVESNFLLLGVKLSVEKKEEITEARFFFDVCAATPLVLSSPVVIPKFVESLSESTSGSGNLSLYPSAIGVCMLSRAVVRSFHAHASPAAFRIATSAQWARGFAKDNKSRTGSKKPIDYSSPPGASTLSKRTGTAQKAASAGAAVGGGSAASASRSSDQSGNPDYSKDQDEYSTRADPERNTVSQSSGAGPGVSNIAPEQQQRSFPGYSESQDEFQKPASPTENTAPQSSSQAESDPVLAAAQAKQQPPNRPLPDLTQGIPSTLDAELAASNASIKSDRSSLNVTEDERDPSAGGGGRDGGELPKSTYVSSQERRRNKVANYMYASFLFFAVTGTIYMGRNWETPEEENAHPETPSGWGVGLFYNRARARIGDTLGYYTEPAFPKLLPDVQPEWERPYTLVLSLEDLLVHSEWTRDHGWRMAKRPGVDYFLRYLSQYFEIVVFTSVPSYTGGVVMQKLDPFRMVMWPLFREATRYSHGEYIKDLSYLNRDLSKVILIDTVPSHAKLQPENAIILSKWTGAPQDKELVSFIPFLEYIATMGLSDTREVLKSFEGKHIPTEFARREALAREKFEKQLAEDRAKRPKRSGLGFLGNALGMKAQGGGALDGQEQSALEEGKMLQDIMRERGQKTYEAIEKEIRENSEKWLKEISAEEEKGKEEQIKSVKTSLSGMFGGSGK
ncbi:MAG: mitochondrial inner membrane protein required for protein import [Pycnora praestabilis]|nr:MAG: mitochondrial inner membrane protein required for protein import [Pycnora praestabilis]